MSNPTHVAILGKIISDPEFRKQVFADPENTLKANGVTDQKEIDLAVAFINLAKEAKGNNQNALDNLSTIHAADQ